MGKVHRRGTGYTVQTLKRRHKRPCASAPSVPANVTVAFSHRWVRRHVDWRARVDFDTVDTDVAGRELDPELYHVQLRYTDASGNPQEGTDVDSKLKPCDEGSFVVFHNIARPKSWYVQVRVRVLNRIHGGKCWSAWSGWTTPEQPASGTLEGPDPITGLSLTFDRVEGGPGRPWRAKAAWNTSPEWTPTDGDPVDIDGYDLQLRVYGRDGTTLLNTRRGIFVEHNAEELTSRHDFGNIRGRRHYQVRVRPRALGRPGAWSSWTVKASPAGAPAAPTNVTCEERTPRDVLVQWDAPTDLTDVDGYRVRIIRGAGGPVVEERTVGGALTTRYHWKVPRSEVVAHPGANYRARVFSIEQPLSDAVDEDAPSEGTFDSEELSATYVESTDTPITGVWDSSEVPAVSTDGSAPSSSPTPSVSGGPGYLAVSWEGVANADPVTYEVHVGTSTGFTPDATTLAGETPGTVMFVRTNPAGGDFAYDTDYFVVLIAKDDDGSAAAGAEVNAQLDRVGTNDIAANAIVAAKLAAEMVLSTSLYVPDKTNRRIELTPTGLRLVDPTLGELFSAPLDPDQAVKIRGEVEAGALDVTGPALFRDADNLVDRGAGITLALDLQAPQVSPTLSDAPLDVVGLADLGYAHAPWHDGTNLYVVQGSVRSVIKSVTKLSSDGSTEVASAELDFPAGFTWDVRGAIKLGSYWYVLASRSGTPWWLVYDLDANGLPGTLLTNSTAVQGTATGTLWMGTDGTGLKVARPQSGGIRLESWTVPGTGAVPTFSSEVTVSDSLASNVVGGYYGSADFGAASWVLMVDGQSNAQVYNTSGTELTSAEWPLGMTPDVEVITGLWYDGSNFHELVPDSFEPTLAWKFSATWLNATGPTEQYRAAFTWYDSDATGGTHETALSPRGAITHKSRRDLIVSWPTVPEGAAGTDDPDSVRLYLKQSSSDPGSSFASYFLQGAYTGGTTTTLTSYDDTTAGSAGTAFPNATPAELRSSGGEPLVRANGFSRTRLRFTTATSVPDATNRYVRFGTEDVDTDGYHPSTTDALSGTGDSTYDITLPFTGNYLAVCSAEWPNNATGRRRIILYLNGTEFDRSNMLPVGGEATRHKAPFDIDAAAGDTLRFQVFHSGGVALNLNNAKLTLIYLGPA